MVGDGPRPEDRTSPPLVQAKPCYKPSVSTRKVRRFVPSHDSARRLRQTANGLLQSGRMVAHVDLAGHGGGDEGGALLAQEKHGSINTSPQFGYATLETVNLLTPSPLLVHGRHKDSQGADKITVHRGLCASISCALIAQPCVSRLQIPPKKDAVQTRWIWGNIGDVLAESCWNPE